MYRYELHCHENMVSRCARWSPREMVGFYASLGYTGVVVTDHFFNNGSCTVPLSLPWREAVTQFCAGYERTREEGEKVGLDVFFAFEYTANTFMQEDLSPLGEAGARLAQKNSLAGCDFLIYGLGRDWLLMQDAALLRLSVNDFLHKVRQDGGTVIQAHPFRLAQSYMDHISLFPAYTDGIEVLNGNPNTVGRGNRLAAAYAAEYGFFPTAGTDAHAKTERLALTELPARAASVEELIAALRARKASLSLIENPLWGK